MAAINSLTIGSGLSLTGTTLSSTGGISTPVSIANGGTATTSAVTNGVYYYNGTNAEADNSLTFNPSTGLNVNTTATSTFAGAVSVAGGITTGGITTGGEVDPIVSYSCAGVSTATTGTISSGTNSLSVLSASGWSTGMGIAVANAGPGGSTELITTVTAISGTSFTLGANASATATGQVINHDDTVCLQRAINSGRNPHLRLGTYNVTSELAVATPQVISCDGAVNQTTHTGGTTIMNRGTTNNVINISSAYVTLNSCAIEQNASITPTAGYGIVIGNAVTRVRMAIIENNLVYGTYGGITLTGNVIPAYIHDNFFWSLGGASNTAGAMYINNPSTAGDVHWVANEFRVINLGPVGYIVNADVEQFVNDKFNSANPALTIDTTLTGGTVVSQSFVGSSFEGGSNTGPLIQINGTPTGISFVGGEIGTDNGNGGVSIAAGVTDVSIIGVDFHQVTGTPIANSATTHIQVSSNTASGGNAIIPNHIFTGSNVGIATTTPSRLFTIQGASNNLLAYDGTNFAVSPTDGSITSLAGGITLIPGNSAAARFTIHGMDSSGIIGLTTSSGSLRTLNIVNQGAGGLQTIFGNTSSNNAGAGTNRIGINATSSPFSLLSIAGSAGGTTPLFAISSSTAAFATTTVFQIDQNGKLISNALATSTFSGAVQSTCFTINGTSCLTSGSGTVSSGTTGQMPYYAANGTTLTATSTLFLTGGSVGVGLTNPGARFEVQGTTTDSTAQAVDVWNSANTNLLRIRNDGNIGIGSTSPWALLSVNANGIPVTSAQFSVGSSTATNLVVANNGFVGIGTSSPVSALTIVNPNPSNLSSLGLYSGASNRFTSFTIGRTAVEFTFAIAAGTNQFVMGAQAGDSLLQGNNNLFINTAALKTQTTGGVFGIGTTTPSALFSAQITPSTQSQIPFLIGSSTAAFATSTLFMIDNTGHLISGSPKGSLSSCGTTNSLNGTDEGGTIMFTGTLVTACTLTFANPVPANQNLSCLISSNSLTLPPAVTATSSTAVTFGVSSGVSSDTFYYKCSRNLND